MIEEWKMLMWRIYLDWFHRFIWSYIYFSKFLTFCTSVKSTKTCICPLSSLTVICLNAFQPLTYSNRPLRMRSKKRDSEVNGVKTVCFLLHQEKPGSSFHAYINQLTSLLHYGLWVVLRLSCADISDSIWVNIPFLYLSIAAFIFSQAKTSLQNP